MGVAIVVGTGVCGRGVVRGTSHVWLVAMRTMRLVDVVFRSSLIAMPACFIVDCSREERDHTATRAEYGTLIDDCIADHDACRVICNNVVAYEEPADGYAHLTKCELTDVAPGAPPDWIRLHVEFDVDYDCMGGRRPGGFVERAGRATTAAAWLARAAAVEAASVTAFERLVRALIRLHAPRDLVASARRAIGDEIRHARVVGGLARRMGAVVDAPVIADVAEPTPVEIARENAVEGQVAETLGVLVATCQGRAANDPAMRAVFGAIARDEARHAALAYRLGTWLEPRLTATERAQVADARRAAIATIVDQIGVGLAPRDRAVLGIPPVGRLRAAAAAMFAELGKIGIASNGRTAGPHADTAR
jgi:hypothetical protein